MIAFEQQRVTLTSGIELDVVDIGPRDGPVLIFLHGFPESHRTWRYQIRHFSKRFRCIAPDQRGYGGSSKPSDAESYRPELLAGDVFHLADALGVDRFTIVGHDWGGVVAWVVALLGQGTRVQAAVIANAPHPEIFQRLLWLDPAQRRASQYIRLFRDTANDALTRERGLLPLLLKAFDWQKMPAMEAGERELLLRDWQNPEAAIAMLNWYRASPVEVPAMDAPFSLPAHTTQQPTRLAIPSLVVWALDDPALPPVNLDGLENAVEHLTIVPVTGCGHFVPWEAPDTVIEAMEAFLAAL